MSFSQYGRGFNRSRFWFRKSVTPFVPGVALIIKKSIAGYRFGGKIQFEVTGINLIKSWAGSEQEKPSLYVEVNLMDVVKDLRANLESLSDNLISLQPNDLQSQKTLNGWGLTIERLAAGDVSKIEMEIVTHTMDRAQEADTLCATAHRK